MNLFMLQHKKTRRWFRKGCGMGNPWVENQQDGAVWTTPKGAQSAKGKLTHMGRDHAETQIVPLTAVQSATHVTSDDGDWEGIYIGGELLAEGHSIDPDNLLTVMGIPVNSREINFEAHGITRLPEKLEDLK